MHRERPAASSEDGASEDGSTSAEGHDPGGTTEACNYWDFCPNCGGRLYNRGCKYRCVRCHYFMSCSDFD